MAAAHGCVWPLTDAVCCCCCWCCTHSGHHPVVQGWQRCSCMMWRACSGGRLIWRRLSFFSAVMASGAASVTATAAAPKGRRAPTAPEAPLPVSAAGALSLADHRCGVLPSCMCAITLAAARAACSGGGASAGPSCAFEHLRGGCVWSGALWGVGRGPLSVTVCALTFQVPPCQPHSPSRLLCCMPPVRRRQRSPAVQRGDEHHCVALLQRRRQRPTALDTQQAAAWLVGWLVWW